MLNRTTFPSNLAKWQICHLTTIRNQTLDLHGRGDTLFTPRRSRNTRPGRTLTFNECPGVSNFFPSAAYLQHWLHTFFLSWKNQKLEIQSVFIFLLYLEIDYNWHETRIHGRAVLLRWRMLLRPQTWRNIPRTFLRLATCACMHVWRCNKCSTFILPLAWEKAWFIEILKSEVSQVFYRKAPSMKHFA